MPSARRDPRRLLWQRHLISPNEDLGSINASRFRGPGTRKSEKNRKEAKGSDELVLSIDAAGPTTKKTDKEEKGREKSRFFCEQKLERGS